MPFNRDRFRALSLAAVFAFQASALARVPVYEPFDYPAGTRTPSQLSGGSGWSGPFAASVSTIEIAGASLTSAAALPSNGRALLGPSTAGPAVITLTRSFAAPFSTGDDVWVSFITRRNNLPSSWQVLFNDAAGPGVGSAAAGLTLHRGDGSFPLFTGQFDPVQSFTLLRIAADSGGTRTISLWNNPAPGTLGSPTASVTGPSAALGSLRLTLGPDTIFDEFRIDTDLSGVFVPTGGAATVWIGLAASAITRRRAGR